MPDSYDGRSYMGNPGSVSEAANRAAGHVIADVDSRLGRPAEMFEAVKGRLLKSFGAESFSPDNEEIYRNRASIQSEFQSQHVAASARGQAMDPLVAERMEQLAAVYPDEIDARHMSALESVVNDPAAFGLQTESTGLFSSNKGVEFKAL